MLKTGSEYSFICASSPVFPGTTVYRTLFNDLLALQIKFGELLYLIADHRINYLGGGGGLPDGGGGGIKPADGAETLLAALLLLDAPLVILPSIGTRFPLAYIH